MLTKSDLNAIGKLIDQKLDQKLKPINEFVIETKIKLTKLLEFADFGERALTSLLDESQENFEQKLPQRVKKLEDIHPGGHHAS